MLFTAATGMMTVPKGTAIDQRGKHKKFAILASPAREKLPGQAILFG